MTKKYGEWSGEMPFPNLKDCIFIDIETDLDMNQVWLIGVKTETTEEQFLAYNYDEEKKILQQFTSFMKNHPTKVLVCYSTTNFDFRVLFNAGLRLGLNEMVEQLSSRSLLDMGTQLRRYFTPYGRSYSLKMLRFLIGYNYADITLDGEEVAIRYYQQVKGLGRITDEFASKALQYNLDDIRILRDLIEKFSENIQFTSNFTKNINITQIKELLNTAIYSSSYRPHFIRISVYKEYTADVLQNLMSLGLTLPQINEGKNVTALYWKSSFSYRLMRDKFKLLDIDSS